MEKDKISVIVPVYKVEQWLEECVISIQNQSYKNIEILLIDDGSPDKCPFICDQFAEKDERIYVIHKENGGVSSARNLGIEAATGRYITFIDSDDYIDSNYISKLYDNLNGCKISECGTICFDEHRIVTIKEKKPLILGWEEYLTESNLKGFLSYAVVYSKLYEKDLFMNIRFPIGCVNGEDESTVFKLVYNAQKISRIYDGLYYYRQRETGASQNKITDKRINDTNDFFDEKISFFTKKERMDLVMFFSAKKAIAFIGLSKNAEKKEHKEFCNRVVKKLFKEFWRAANVPFKYKIYTAYFLLLKIID